MSLLFQFFLWGLWWSRVLYAKSETVISVPIRILDAAGKASELEQTVYGGARDSLRSWNRPREPYGSYVIYDDGPRKIFHGWNPHENFHTRKSEKIRDPLWPNPSLSYQSVYSNTIKVYDDSAAYGSRWEASENRFGFETPPTKPDYEVHYPHRTEERRYYRDRKIPGNFPKLFSPNAGFRFSVLDKPQKTFYADAGYYRTYTVNYRSRNDSADFGSAGDIDPVRKPSSCNFIRLNGQSFPGNDKELCGRANENPPLSLPDYPDYSKFSDREIPVEHRRQNYLKAEMRGRRKRSAGYGYGFDAWKGFYSPYGYDRNYNDYYSSYYPSYNDYDNGPDGNGNYNNYNYNYRNGNYRNRGFFNEDRDRGYNYGRESGGRYFGLDRDDEYQNSQETSSRGLASFLSEGGRREKSRTRTDNDQDDRDSEDSEEDYKNRRREMFNNNNNNSRRLDDDNRNRRGPKRPDGIGGGDEEDGEEGDEYRNGQTSYSSRNFRRNNNNGRRYYNSRSDYHNNHNRGSYGHTGNYPRTNGGDFDRQNRPSGFYG